MKTVWVNLNDRSYPIYLHDDWDVLFQEASVYCHGDKALIITDENVCKLYYSIVEKHLRSLGMQTTCAVVPPGEASKSLKEAEKLYTAALNASLERSSLIVALGGGVIGDLAGFVASTYMRGIPFIQIPTTLLAQVDSSIGGKTAVNHPLAKNIIGSFYQPKCVIMNAATLRTLPRREIANGMAEIIKHGIIKDEAFLAWLEDNVEQLKAQNISILIQAIHRSCEIKADVVTADEREQGLRTILNFGHTIGHAIEAAAGFSTYTHGEAVSMGMVAEAVIAHLMGLIPMEYINRIRNILSGAGLPVTIPDIDNSSLLKLMQHDKKNKDGKIAFVLPTAPGQAGIFRNVETQVIFAALDAARIQQL
ncbi:MAG TPA: 3-dehydroquinate synthase [Clostridiales bacterium]|nr:3-dehydroquinate synthase [Clostridiales bacterium]